MKLRLLMSGLIIGVLLLTQACSRKLDPEEPCNFVQSAQFQRVSWKSDLPIKLNVHSSVPDEAYPALESAIQRWNQVMNSLGVEGNTFEMNLTHVSDAMATKQDFNNMVYWIKEGWEPNLRSQQARTTIYWTGARIYEADLRINDEHHDFHFPNDVSALSTSGGRVDLESLFVHELGHALGLAHNSEEESVMQVELANGVDRRKLGAVDIDSVSCEYH